MTPAVSPPLKWYGGKHYLAHHIIALMPPHVHYVESFAGGLSVLLAKNPEGVSEVANDAHGDLVNFYRVLRDPAAFAEFHRTVSLVPFSRQEWQESRAFLKGEEGGPVARAVAFFVFCRQSFAGRMDGFAPSPKKRTRRGMNEQASAWLGVIDGLPAVHERLKRVYVECGRATDVIARHDGPDTLHYCDPPYLHETRTGGPVYAHEMTEEQHADLCTVLRKCAGKVVLSGYPSDLYRVQLEEEGWHRTDFDIANHAAGAGKAKRRMTECVWTNFKPEVS